MIPVSPHDIATKTEAEQQQNGGEGDRETHSAQGHCRFLFGSFSEERLNENEDEIENEATTSTSSLDPKVKVNGDKMAVTLITEV